MVYKSEHYRASFLYEITGTGEIGQCDIMFGPAGPATTVAPIPTGTAEELDDIWRASVLTEGNLTRANYSRYLGVKVAALDINGEYKEEPQIFLGTPSAGGTNGQAPQVTLAVSLRSGSTLGKGNYGRMYLPFTTLTQEAATYRGTAAAAQAVADTFAAAVADMNVAVAPLRAVIATQSPDLSFDRPVTEIGVGRLNDTQRRRRNRLEEDYRFSSL